MAKVVQLSFGAKDEDLYAHVMAHRNYSAFIKDCIQFYLENAKKPEKNNTATGSSNSVEANELQNILKF